MPLRILCVEDHPDIASYLKILLERQGYEVVIAGNFTEGFAWAQLQSFNLILLDNGLPDGTGLELCRRIRISDEQTPIVFYTSSYDWHLKSQAFAAGAQDFVKKSDEIDVLLNTIAIHLSKERVGEPLLLASS